MTVRVWTACSDYPGPHRLNVETGEFAPSHELEEKIDVWDISIEQYRAAYRLEMRRSYKKNKALWDVVLSGEKVVLICSCEDPKSCHRMELAAILGELGAIVHGEITEWDRTNAEPPIWSRPMTAIGTAILVTGDRRWDDKVLVRKRLDIYPSCSLLIHGDCEGGLDRMAAGIAASIGMVVIPMAPSVDAKTIRKFTDRNTNMVEFLSLLRWSNWKTHVEAFVTPSSKGTWDCVNKAKKNGFVPHVTKSGFEDEGK